MTVGKPDFNINSFGIQYKEKHVTYTTKRIGMNSKIQSDVDQSSEDAHTSKLQSSKKPNALNITGNSPTETQPLTHMVDGKQVDKPKKSKYGKQVPKDTLQSATSSPPSPAPKESTSVLDDVPNTKQEKVTREGGTSHAGMKAGAPKARIGGRAYQEASAKLRESKQNPVLPKNASNDIILKMNLLKLDLTTLK